MNQPSLILFQSLCHRLFRNRRFLLAVIGVGCSALSSSANEKLENLLRAKLDADAAAQEDKSETKKPARKSPVDFKELMHKRLDSLSSGAAGSGAAISFDSEHARLLLKERGEWLQGLSDEERNTYKKAFARFLIEQKISGTTHLNAIKGLDPSKIAVVAEQFDRLRPDDDSKLKAEAFNEIATDVVFSLGGFGISEDDQFLLANCLILYTVGKTDDAFKLAGKKISSSAAEDFSMLLLLILEQAESDIPVDLLLAAADAGEYLQPAKISEWAAGPKKQVAVVEKKVEAKPAEKPVVKKPEPPKDPDAGFTKISTSMGTVKVPSDPEVMDAWVAAVYSIKMSGFVSLGNEVAVLLQNGEMYRKGDDWRVTFKDHVYHFDIESVTKSTVHLKAAHREEQGE